MQFKSIIEKFWTRLWISILTGIVFRFGFDVIIGLSYSTYILDDYVIYYALSVISSFIVFQLYWIITKWLNKIATWHESTKKRFWIQFVFQLVIAQAILFGLKIAVEVLLFKNLFFVLNIEVFFCLVIFIVVLAYNLIEYGTYLIYNSRYSLAQVERYKKENAEFKYESLMNQVNPHFLFNSLNTLSSLVYSNTDTAATYIRELAKVYRYVLENRQNELVKVRTEYDFITAYIYLLELRFKSMLHFNIEIEAKEMEKQIAPMTIQLLIENAVKHNVISSKKNLHIEITTHVGYLIVKNNIQLKTAKEYSSGIGLNNIKSRYEYLNQKTVEVENSEKDFIVRIPLISKVNDNEN